jgi:hypothetical protein
MPTKPTYHIRDCLSQKKIHEIDNPVTAKLLATAPRTRVLKTLPPYSDDKPPYWELLWLRNEQLVPVNFEVATSKVKYFTTALTAVVEAFADGNAVEAVFPDGTRLKLTPASFAAELLAIPGNCQNVTNELNFKDSQ